MGCIVPKLIVCALSAPRGSDASVVCTLSAPHGPSASLLSHVVCSARFRRICCSHVVRSRFSAQFVHTLPAPSARSRTHRLARSAPHGPIAPFFHKLSAPHCSNTWFVGKLSAPHGSSLFNTRCALRLRGSPNASVVYAMSAPHGPETIVRLARCLRRMVPRPCFCFTRPAPPKRHLYARRLLRAFFLIICPALKLATPAISTLQLKKLIPVKFEI